MYQMSVVIAQKEGPVAERLAHELKAHFRNVAVARTASEVHDTMIERRAKVAVLDLDLVHTSELRNICREFPDTVVVATHRTPDEEIWKACMEVGAADCCHPSEVDGILRGIVSSAPLSRAVSAA